MALTKWPADSLKSAEGESGCSGVRQRVQCQVSKRPRAAICQPRICFLAGVFGLAYRGFPKNWVFEILHFCKQGSLAATIEETFAALTRPFQIPSVARSQGSTPAAFGGHAGLRVDHG